MKQQMGSCMFCVHREVCYMRKVVMTAVREAEPDISMYQKDGDVKLYFENCLGGVCKRFAAKD